MRDDAPRLLGDVPDGAAHLLHGFPDLRSDQVREVRSVRLRSGVGRTPAKRATAAPGAARSGSSSGSNSQPRVVAETPGRFARRPRAGVWRRAQDGRRVPRGTRLRRSRKRRPRRQASAQSVRRALRGAQEAFGSVDLLITPSAFRRDEFIKHFGVTPDRIVHSANGMDLSYIEQPPQDPEPASIRFGYVGSIIKTKGVHVLVDAFLRAVMGRADLELHVFGSAEPLDEDLLRGVKAEDAHCPFVTFHGRFDNTKISSVLQQFDVLVLPSIWFENAPLTLNEAAISATPVLVSEIGGMLEFVRANQYGWTFRLGDVEDLASKMLRLADEPALLSRAGLSPAEDQERRGERHRARDRLSAPHRRNLADPGCCGRPAGGHEPRRTRLTRPRPGEAHRRGGKVTSPRRAPRLPDPLFAHAHHVRLARAPPLRVRGNGHLHAQHREGPGRGRPRRLGVRAARGPRHAGLPHARREAGTGSASGS